MRQWHCFYYKTPSRASPGSPTQIISTVSGSRLQPRSYGVMFKYILILFQTESYLNFSLSDLMMFQHNGYTDCGMVPCTTGDGKENFNIEDFISTLPVKPFEVRPSTHQLVSQAILGGLISEESIMSTGTVYPPLNLSEPSFIPYSTMPYTNYAPICTENWPVHPDLYQTTCSPYLAPLTPIIHPSSGHVAAPFIQRHMKRPLESKLTWSSPYMTDLSYTPPAMTLAPTLPPTLSYSGYPCTMPGYTRAHVPSTCTLPGYTRAHAPSTCTLPGYTRAHALSTCAPEIFPRVIPDSSMLPSKPYPPIKALHRQFPREVLVNRPPALPSNLLATSQYVFNPPAKKIKLEELSPEPVEQKPLPYRFVQPKNSKQFARIKNKKLLKSKKAPSRAQKLVLSLVKPLLACHRKGIDDLTRGSPIKPETTRRNQTRDEQSPESKMNNAHHDLLAVAMLTKSLHFEVTKRNPLHPVKRYLVQDKL